jgi:hypothetical protein
MTKEEIVELFGELKNSTGGYSFSWNKCYNNNRMTSDNKGALVSAVYHALADSGMIRRVPRDRERMRDKSLRID